MSDRYRPQFLWLLMGPMIGAFSGAVVGTVLVWSVALAEASSLTTSDVLLGLVFGLYLGGVYGGCCGIAVGLVVAVPLVFLVGRHLPRDVARRRAYVLGAVLPPLVLVAGVVVLLDVRLSWPHGEEFWSLLALAGAGLMGGRLAAWAAGMDELPTPVS